MAYNIQTFSDYHNLSRHLATHIFSTLQSAITTARKFNLGLATGNSPQGTYQALIELLGHEYINLSNLHTFNLDEYYPIQQSHPQSFYTEMMETFWQPLNKINTTFSLNNAHILDGSVQDTSTECARYETLIANCGGIDMQILGLGPNGHIAFNEPGSAGDSRTRKIKLTPQSREALSPTFNHKIDDVPQYGLTMGIGTILEAKEIVLIVTGERKREVFKKLLTMTAPDPSLPASWLMNHDNVSIYTDISL